MKTSLITTSFGSKEYYYSEGEGQTIVLLSGMGGSLYEWNEIVESELSFLAYNRGGYGKSESTGETDATPHEELHSLLQALHIDGKIVLAGFSYGGLIAQGFAMNYPDRVAGVILIDSTSINMHRLDEVEVSDEKLNDDYWINMCDTLSALTPDEINREQEPSLHPKQYGWNKDIQQALLNHDINPKLYASVGRELRRWGGYAKSLQHFPFPSVPLVVLARDQETVIKEQTESGLPKSEIEELEKVWYELLQEQRDLVPDSSYYVAEGSGHQIPINRPDLIQHAFERILK
ncbi:alpha/beta hydrolase [Alkalihalobacillus sp. R86527]|uniref:alpha/beta hydrolase n=1 Tax=Alkalihalobacillus sp. R86527 TaxID=3093863 RepID=UPI0036723B1D